jgi:hypothetical protein
MTLLKPRKSARPNPVVRFFDTERLLRTIDDDNLDTKAKANYDESDDDEDVVLLTRKRRGSELTTEIHHSLPFITIG